MEAKHLAEERNVQDQGLFFALDIGTRSIIGIVGRVENERFKVLAIEKEEHSKRAMLDGQIDNISQVARVVTSVTDRLEKRLGYCLKRVCIAAAGRALHTERGRFQLALPSPRRIDDDLIGQLEAGAVSAAEARLSDTGNEQGQFFLVGYTVSQYLLDNYPLSTLKDHMGQTLEAEVVATFLPSEVVESLYSTMHMAGLEVVNLTLEPIAAINAAIPAELRLLNLVLADIGAGTSDIAACRDGSLVGYTMATMAGDEITETIMRAYLVDFQTAERLKSEMSRQETLSFTDILGLEQQLSAQALKATVLPQIKELALELSHRIVEINGGPPSALFLSGGGSKLEALREELALALEMDPKRVAVAGSNFRISAFSEEYDLNDPEYTTPLGIAISAGLGLINDSYRVTLNGQPAKLFRSGALTALDVLMMNGFVYSDLLGRTGQSITITLDGRRTVYRGQPATPCILQINGKEAPPSTVIQTGDNITFTPAQPGQPASKTLAQAVGSETAAAQALLNGAHAPVDQPLQSGDVIETSPVPPPALAITAPPPVTMPVPSEEGTAPIQPQAGVERQTSAPGEGPAVQAVAAAPAVLEEAPAPMEKKRPSPVTIQEKAPPSPQPATRFFFLNGSPLALPVKPDGSAYYLMDLLSYSGIDFEHLERRVILEINGESGQFVQELKDGDAVSIRYEDDSRS